MRLIFYFERSQSSISEIHPLFVCVWGGGGGIGKGGGREKELNINHHYTTDNKL